MKLTKKQLSLLGTDAFYFTPKQRKELDDEGISAWIEDTFFVDAYMNILKERFPKIFKAMMDLEIYIEKIGWEAGEPWTDAEMAEGLELQADGTYNRDALVNAMIKQCQNDIESSIYMGESWTLEYIEPLDADDQIRIIQHAYGEEFNKVLKSLALNEEDFDLAAMYLNDELVQEFIEQELVNNWDWRKFNKTYNSVNVFLEELFDWYWDEIGYEVDEFKIGSFHELVDFIDNKDADVKTHLMKLYEEKNLTESK